MVLLQLNQVLKIEEDKHFYHDPHHFVKGHMLPMQNEDTHGTMDNMGSSDRSKGAA